MNENRINSIGFDRWNVSMTFIYIMEKFCIHFQRQNGFWLTVQVFQGFFSKQNEDRIKPLSSDAAIFAVEHVDLNNAGIARVRWWRRLRSTTNVANARAETIWKIGNKQQWQYFSLCVDCHLPSRLRTCELWVEKGMLWRWTATEIDGNDNDDGASCKKKKNEKIIISRRRRRTWSCRKLFYKWKWCNIPQYRWTKIPSAINGRNLFRTFVASSEMKRPTKKSARSSRWQ